MAQSVISDVGNRMSLDRFDQGAYPLLRDYDIRGVEVDDCGRHWIASSAGLLLFDGHNVFRPVKQLADADVCNILCDPVTHNMWVYAQQSFGILDLQSMQYTILKRIDIKNTSCNASIKVDRLNHVSTVFPDNSFFMFDNHGKILRHLSLDTLLGGSRPSGFGVSADSLFFSRWGFQPTIVAYSLRTGIHRRHVLRNTRLNWLIDVDVLGTGQLIVVDISKGFFILNQNTYQIMPNAVLDSLKKENKCDAYGFQRWDEDTWTLVFGNGAMYNFSKYGDFSSAVSICHEPDMIPHYYRPLVKNINARYGLLFNENGLFLLNKYNHGISTMLHRNGAHVSKVSMRNIVSDSLGNLYVGSYQGLLYFDKKRGEWERFDHPIPSIGGKELLAAPIPFSLYLDGNYLYIGSEGYPFYRFNRSSRRFETAFYQHPDIVANNFWNVNVIFPMEESRLLLLGYSRGLAMYDLDEKKLSLIRNTEWNKSENAVYVIKKLSDGTLLVGTKLGLFRLDPHTWKPQLLTATRDESIYDILALPERSEIWAASASKGVMVMDGRGRLKRYIGVKDGLSYPTVVGLTKALDGAVWILTNNGLSHYDGKRIVNYSDQDGLSENGINRFSYLNDGKGTLYIGTINGLTILNEKKLEIPVPDQVFISQIKIWRSGLSAYQEYSLGQIAKLRELTVQVADRGLMLNMGNSNLANLDKISFEYRILEISDEWRSLGHTGDLRFDGLPYGTLHLQMRAINRNNLVSSNTLSLTLKVLVPFYRSPYFYIFLSLIFLTLVVVYDRQRVVADRKLSTQRMVVAQTMHDELGVYFTSIRYRIEMLMKKEKVLPEELDIVHTLFKRVSTVINETLWFIDADKKNIENISEKFEEINDMVLVPCGAKITTEMDINTSPTVLTPLVKQQLCYIYKEAVHNIAKHSKAAEVHITVSINKRNIWIEFANNNIVHTSEKSNQMGLKSIQQRAEKIGCVAQYAKANAWFRLVVKSV
ncbi:MAG: hypothetical protein QM610_05080 [Chitinophagaceae bacterium]